MRRWVLREGKVRAQQRGEGDGERRREAHAAYSTYLRRIVEHFEKRPRRRRGFALV